MAKKIPKSALLGLWHIVSMSAWDEEYINKEVQAFIEFDEEGNGSFQFGYVQGHFDYRTKDRDGKRSAQFGWDGEDSADGTPLEGIGWVILDSDELNGVISFEDRDDSGFVAKRAEGKKGKKGK